MQAAAGLKVIKVEAALAASNSRLVIVFAQKSSYTRRIEDQSQKRGRPQGV
jgi:hypothetical protein